jgi:hypothetical protein
VLASVAIKPLENFEHVARALNINISASMTSEMLCCKTFVMNSYKFGAAMTAYGSFYQYEQEILII